METPIVSIIIPVYKTEQYLAECMNSVLSQNYAELEVILVDDGSPDQCPALCDAYGEKYPQVKVIHQTNRGLGLSRNSGMEAATGKYIFFLDSDDCLDGTDAIGVLVRTAEQEQADIVQGSFRRFGDWGVSEVNVPHLDTEQDSGTVNFRFKGFYMYGHLAYNWGKLYRREFLEENDLKCKAYPFTQDKAHNMSCYAYHPKYAFVQDSVYRYRVNETSVTFRYKDNYMPVWISIASDFQEFLQERGIQEDLGDLMCFHIFFGSFFLAKQELQFKKKGIREAAKALKRYGAHPFVKTCMEELSKGRYLKEIEATSWKLVIRLAAILFRAHGYLPMAAGIALLRKMEIDSRITKSRYQQPNNVANTTQLNSEERALITLLRKSMNEQPLSAADLGTGDVHFLLARAKRHAVLPLLYEGLQNVDIPKLAECRAYIDRESRQTVLQSYRLLFLTKHLIEILAADGIQAVVLKGVATAGLYPVPEIRKSGDVDLLISDAVPEKKLRRAMDKAHFELGQEQHANHHTVFISPDGIHVEIHTLLAEPFADKKINVAMEKRMAEIMRHVKWQSTMGVELPVLELPYHAYELLLHMLQHFMYAGFGLKLLCDWVMIWRQCWTPEDKALFVQLVEESGLKRFAQVITAVCVEYLGLEEHSLAWTVDKETVAEEFLREIFAAEEFGKSDRNRMVMMSGTGLWAYVKEFHHQMHLNFPRAGKCFLCWPVLWLITLIKFLRNNRLVRQTSAGEVLKEAARRSKLIKKIGLFE